jgi:hypothetical protein
MPNRGKACNFPCISSQSGSDWRGYLTFLQYHVARGRSWRGHADHSSRPRRRLAQKHPKTIVADPCTGICTAHVFSLPSSAGGCRGKGLGKRNSVGLKIASLALGRFSTKRRRRELILAAILTVSEIQKYQPNLKSKPTLHTEAQRSKKAFLRKEWAARPIDATTHSLS